MQITTTSANITGNPLRRKRFVRRRMRRALRIPGVTFGQEVARSNRWRRGNYSAMWEAVALTYGKATVGGSREVPISYPAGWHLDDSYVVKVHDGKRRVSPDRFITVALFTVGGHKLAFVNCHPVSRPYLGGWRKRMWDRYLNRLIEIVNDLHDVGRTVVAGGDMNGTRRRLPVLHRDQQVLISAGLDHLWTVPARGKVARLIRRSKVGRTALMDHPILTATFELQES